MVPDQGKVHSSEGHSELSIPGALAELKESIRRQALALGFDRVGFAPAAAPPQGKHLASWLEAGMHGGMSWLARNPHRRQDPRQYHPSAATVVALGVNVRPDRDPLLFLHQPGQAGFGVHARGRDYHHVLREKAGELARWLDQEMGWPVTGRICVDTAPVMEKPLAQAAGLGWQGKNTLLVTRSHGVWLLLAEILLEFPLPPDPPGRDHCGTCTRCLDACPAGAFIAPYRMDSRRCLSYWTIEHKGAIPLAMREMQGTRVYGCDDCLAVCPWNRFAPPAVDRELRPAPGMEGPALRAFRGLDEAGFHQRFDASPVGRLGWVGFLRNLAVALGHWRDGEAAEMLIELLDHPHPLVRGHAVWGLSRHLPRGRAALISLAATETDDFVREELERLGQGSTAAPPSW